MSKEAKVSEVKKALREVYEKGFEIRDVLKQEYNHFSNRPKEEILIDTKLFNYSLFEGFWKLFKIVSENIENPLVQPWIRVIIEQSSDIFYYSKQKEDKKKAIACKYFLCTLGFIGGKQGSLTYERFLNLLEDGEKTKFSNLKNEEYPPEKIHNEWHNLFAHINKNNLPDFIEKYFLNLKGNSIRKAQLDLFYRDMSFYHHPNILMNNLEKEFEDKSHIFRCFTLLYACSVALIKFSTEEIIKKPDINFSEDFYERANKLIENLYMGRKNEKQ